MLKYKANQYGDDIKQINMEMKQQFKTYLNDIDSGINHILVSVLEATRIFTMNENYVYASVKFQSTWLSI